MKRILFIFFVFISITAFSQNIKVVGPDTTTGRPGYLFTLKPQYVQSPLTAVNDSTIGFITGSTGDILYYNGGWLKRSIGTSAQTLHVVGGLPQWVDTAVGGGGGGGIVDSAYFWTRTGNVALSTDWLGTKTATSLRIRTNNTARMVVDSNGYVGIGTATPATPFHSFGVSSIGDSATATNAVRLFNVIGSNAVMRVHRVSTTSTTAGPAIELVHSYLKNGATDVNWDLFADSLSFGIRDRSLTTPADTVSRLAIMKATGNVQIGNNRVDIPSALFSVSSTTKGFLPPVMATGNRNAISSPATGLTIYNTSTNALEWYSGSGWLSAYTGGAYTLAIGNAITSGTAGSVYYGGTSGALAQDNANFFYDATNHRLGLGNAAPAFRLEVGAGGAGSTTELIKINSGATGICGTYYYQNGTVRGLFGLAGGANDLITGSAAGDFNIRNSQRVLFSSDGGTTAAGNINSSSRWFFGGSTSATAIVHIKAGTATASTAPLKFTAGTVLTTPEAGALETNSFNELFYSSNTSTASRGYVTISRYVAKATSYSIGNDDGTIDVTATGQTMTLPTAVGRQGRKYTVILTASGSSTVATTSSENINGSTTYSLSAQYKYVTVQSTNVGWIIIANN